MDLPSMGRARPLLALGRARTALPQDPFLFPYTQLTHPPSPTHQRIDLPPMVRRLALLLRARHGRSHRPSNTTQVLNYGVDNLSSFTPIYGIYENGTPVRVAIMNYLDDPSGASDVHAVIAIAGGTIPSSVQTFGGFFESDGRPMGTENITTVACDTTAQTCTVVVPAPGFALVFLNNGASTAATAGAPTQTYATTAKTKMRNTATVDPAVLSTSNGFRASDHDLAGTSKPPSAAPRTAQASFVAAGLVVATVVAVLARAL
ncbi:hypothetical protein C8F04DRAFT_1262545 [Mycena alexandri]|uniref:Uncharacterized protein n=1 Tax=Mycena alexandri TaxID=1745969 RepID=A0AAD6X204_9AGAR|nr:hypothetical protein C8F04DRAFT_1262545 [Mycena alexandri]